MGWSRILNLINLLAVGSLDMIIVRVRCTLEDGVNSNFILACWLCHCGGKCSKFCEQNMIFEVLETFTCILAL